MCWWIARSLRMRSSTWGGTDKTAVIVCQRHLSSLRIVDYREDSHKTLDYYSGWLRERDYAVSELFLPHDGAHDHLTGQSAQRTLEDLKWLVTVLPNQPVEDGIRALRMAFKGLYIDRRCTRLLECLKRYRRVIPVTTGEPSSPVTTSIRTVRMLRVTWRWRRRCLIAR